MKNHESQIRLKYHEGFRNGCKTFHNLFQSCLAFMTLCLKVLSWAVIILFRMSLMTCKINEFQGNAYFLTDKLYRYGSLAMTDFLVRNRPRKTFFGHMKTDRASNMFGDFLRICFRGGSRILEGRVSRQFVRAQ